MTDMIRKDRWGSYFSEKEITVDDIREILDSMTLHQCADRAECHVFINILVLRVIYFNITFVLSHLIDTWLA